MKRFGTEGRNFLNIFNKNIIIITVFLVESPDWMLSVLVPGLVFCEPICFSSVSVLTNEG